jgi:hypothetical protein
VTSGVLGYAACEPADSEAIVEFLCGDTWPFHPEPRPDPEEVRRQVANGFYWSGESAETYWMVDAGQRVGLVRLFDLDDPTLNPPGGDARGERSCRR